MPATPETPPETRLRPVPEQQLHPPLRPWSRIWRYLLAAAIGVAAWMAAAADGLSVPLTDAQEDLVGAVLFIDLALGLATLAVLPLRRRYPLAVACLTAVVSAASAASLGSAALAIVSMASWRRRAWVVTVAAVYLAGRIGFEVYHARISPAESSGYTSASGIGLGLVFVAAAVATGYYVRSRRELVASLHDRLRTAERERALTAKVARDAERTQIAREMHDVLAHRISLVALHAGALAYREDLSRAETAETARTIQANAQLALTELRQVLGVLRSDHERAGIEQPQPTLAELAALLADVREAGSTVHLDTAGLPADAGQVLSRLPETMSRTSFRIVQEALTNARKHAPGEPVTLRFAGAPGAHLEFEVRNPVAVRAGAGLPSAGVGLIGLAERTELAGGSLAHGAQPDGSFVVRARLPWPS